jgi:uncharacterized protein YjgD (DUF1641 family)
VVISRQHERELLKRLTHFEDVARDIRNSANDPDVERLANAVTQGLQAIRELLQ